MVPNTLDLVPLSTNDALGDFHAYILTQSHVCNVQCLHTVGAWKTVSKENLSQRKFPEENKESLNYMNWLFAKRIKMNLKAVL